MFVDLEPFDRNLLQSHFVSCMMTKHSADKVGVYTDCKIGLTAGGYLAKQDDKLFVFVVFREWIYCSWSYLLFTNKYSTRNSCGEYGHSSCLQTQVSVIREIPISLEITIV